MTASVDAEKVLDKIQHPFLIKATKLGIERLYLSPQRLFVIIPCRHFLNGGLTSSTLLQYDL